MRYLYLAAGLSLFGLAITIGNDIMAFINLPSLLIVFAGSFAFTQAFHGHGSVSNALLAAMSDVPVPGDEAAQCALVLKTLRQTLVGAGVVGTLIGWVQMLQSLDDPTRIGPAFAVSLLTIVYALFTAELIVRPLENRLEAPQ